MLDKIAKMVSKSLVGLGYTGLIASTLLVLTWIVFRYFLQVSFGWGMELAKYSVVVVSFLLAGHCLYKGGHFSITYFFQRLTGRPRTLVLAAQLSIGLLVSIVMLIYSVDVVLHEIHTGRLSEEYTLKMWQVTAPALLGGFGSLTFYYLRDFVRLIRTTFGSQVNDKEKAST